MRSQSPPTPVSANPSDDVGAAVEIFLRQLSQHSPDQQICTECGAVMRPADFTCNLFGTEKSWNLSLAVCDWCNDMSRVA
jgi:hypothetical protein